MPRYAQINIETGAIESDSFLRDENMEKEFHNLIPVPNNFNLINKKYDFETKSFVDCVSIKTE